MNWISNALWNEVPRATVKKENNNNDNAFDIAILKVTFNVNLFDKIDKGHLHVNKNRLKTSTAMNKTNIIEIRNECNDNAVESSS